MTKLTDPWPFLFHGISVPIKFMQRRAIIHVVPDPRLLLPLRFDLETIGVHRTRVDLHHVIFANPSRVANLIGVQYNISPRTVLAGGLLRPRGNIDAYVGMGDYSVPTLLPQNLQDHQTQGPIVAPDHPFLYMPYVRGAYGQPPMVICEMGSAELLRTSSAAFIPVLCANRDMEQAKLVLGSSGDRPIPCRNLLAYPEERRQAMVEYQLRLG